MTRFVFAEAGGNVANAHIRNYEGPEDEIWTAPRQRTGRRIHLQSRESHSVPRQLARARVEPQRRLSNRGRAEGSRDVHDGAAEGHMIINLFPRAITVLLCIGAMLMALSCQQPDSYEINISGPLTIA